MDYEYLSKRVKLQRELADIAEHNRHYLAKRNHSANERAQNKVWIVGVVRDSCRVAQLDGTDGSNKMAPLLRIRHHRFDLIAKNALNPRGIHGRYGVKIIRARFHRAVVVQSRSD
jgi:hypothetical protein